MPDFYLRAWATQVLIASEHYRVIAPTRQEAISILEDLQDEVQDEGSNSSEVVTHPNVERLGYGGSSVSDDVRLLDPEEVTDGSRGIIEVDENDNPKPGYWWHGFEWLGPEDVDEDELAHQDLYRRMKLLMQEAVAFRKEEFDDDWDISGADVIDFFARWRQQAKALLEVWDNL